MSAPRTTRASATATERELAINLQDAQSLLRRYGLGPPLVTASGPGGTFAAAVCLAHADATPWLVVAGRDEEEHGESTAAPIPGRLGTCLSGEALAAGGIAAHACAVIVGEIDGIEHRVQPTPERAWVLVFAPVAPPTSLTIREINASGEVLDVAEIEIGAGPAEPARTFIHDARARIRRLRSGAFPTGRTSY
jgi:hypothetical protein